MRMAARAEALLVLKEELEFRVQDLGLRPVQGELGLRVFFRLLRV